jgi:hypothetical protein
MELKRATPHQKVSNQTTHVLFFPVLIAKLIEPQNCLYTDIKGWECSISFSARLICSLKAMTENQGLRDMEKLPCLIPFAHR